MKTSNIEPHGLHATAATRGQRSALLAGAKGMIWRDAVTESVGQIRDMTVGVGLTFTDNEDGTGILTVGGDIGPSGPEPESEPILIPMLNNSGTDLAVGDVVVVDETADEAVTVTTTPGDTRIAGVVQSAILDGEIGPVLFNGYAAELQTAWPIARGQYAKTSATGGEAAAVDDREAGTFAVYLTAPSVDDVVEGVAITEEETSGTSLSIDMPDELQSGRALFLALYIDPTSSSPTITGWTRVGSTDDFYYFTKTATGSDTASASWTGSSPAAAVVIQFDERVDASDLVEDFDYDATNSAAAITGMTGGPRIAIAGVQAAVDEPADWTALASTSVLTESGGAASNLVPAATVTQDPDNTSNWTNLANIKDADLGTSATIPTVFGTYHHGAVADLGSAADVSAIKIAAADGGNACGSADHPCTAQHSSDGSSWTTISGTWSSKVGGYKTFTWAGGDINARYWRVYWSGGGSHGGYDWREWQIIGAADLIAVGTIVGRYIGTDAGTTSPFTGASKATDAVFALNLTGPLQPSALLFGPDLGGSTAGDVSYDNSTSGLTATDVQAAIDEVVAAGGVAASLVLTGVTGAAQTPGIGSSTSNLAFGTVAVDTQSGYNATNKEWTCGVTGVYQISYTLGVVSQTAGAGNHTRSFFRVAGSAVDDAGIQVMGQGGTNVWNSGGTVRALSSGNTISVQAQPFGANATINLRAIRITRLA